MISNLENQDTEFINSKWKENFYSFSGLESANATILNNFKDNDYTTEFNLDEKNLAYICDSHKRPLEIVCMDHKVKICTSCALFGEHKNHTLRSEEDIVKEVAIKTEVLIEFYELVEKNAEGLVNIDKNEINDLKKTIENNKKCLKEKVKIFFKELRFLLKTKESQIIEEIETCYNSNFEKKLCKLDTGSKELKDKIKLWKKE